MPESTHGPSLKSIKLKVVTSIPFQKNELNLKLLGTNVEVVIIADFVVLAVVVVVLVVVVVIIVGVDIIIVVLLAVRNIFP